MVYKTKKQNALKILRLGVFGFFLSAILFIPLTAFAQFTIDSNTPSIFGIMNATDLVSTIIAVVQWVLAITGLIAVIVIIYGGFIWMTARGDADKIKKAKKILLNAVIGLVIVLFAWVIVYFVIDFVTDATGSGTGCNIGSYVDCQECVDNGSGLGEWVANNSVPSCPVIDPPHYQVRWEEPPNNTPPTDNVTLCAAVQAGFDGITPPWLNATSVTADSVRITDGSGTNVSLDSGFDVATDSNAFGYRHNTEWLPNETYTVEINPITSTDKVQSQVGSVNADNYSWSFITGTTSDEEPPIVTDWTPKITDTDVCLTPPIEVYFNETMYAPSINSDNITVSPQNPTDLKVTGIYFGSNPSQFTAKFNKPLVGNTTYTITLNATAPDGFQDSCGNLLDCGNGTNACTSDGTAEGSSADNFSWSFTTKDTTDISCDPEITQITHTGSYSSNAIDIITVEGRNFGGPASLGAINFSNKFWGTVVDATDTVGVNSRCYNTVALPNTGGADESVACIKDWDNNAIETLVPAGGITLASLGSGATGGNVSVRRGAADVSDPNSDFADENSPHIRRLYPTQGGVGQFVTVSGENFTNTPQAVYLRKGNYEVEAQTCSTGAWGDTQIVIEIPNDSNFVVGDEILVQVDVDPSAPNDGRDRSNLQKFILTNDPPTPGLCTINPTCHLNAPNTVTVTGKYLTGTNVGYYQAQLEHAPTIYNSSSVTNVTDTSADITSPGTLPNDSFKLSVDGPNGVSNALDYLVPCTPGASLIYENQCNLSATPQVFPSPNPYPDSQNICVNLNRISFRFSEAVIPGGTGNYELRQCTNGKSDCDTAYTNIGIGAVFGNPAGTTSVALGNFVTAFVADTWYRVTVRGDIENLSGAELGDDEVWFFKTRDDATPCVADQLAMTATDADGLTPFYVDATSTTDYPNTVLYDAQTVTNNCQSVSMAGSYAWTSTDTTIAQCTSGTCGTADTQLVDAQQKDGATTIRATIGGLTAARQLRVHLNYCQVNSDCATTIDIGGTPTTCTSTCNIAAERCEPHTISMTPANGPESTITTLRGCYYGPTAGKVYFDTTEASYICGPSTWNTNGTEIKVAVPAGFSIGDVPDVTVETTQPLTSNALPFTINGLCGNGEPLPANGVPPGLCSISPVSGPEQTPVTLRGEGLPDGTGLQDSVEFTSAVALGSDTTWTSANVVSTRVPAGATAGDVIVNATSTSGNACESNPVSFSVSCSSNGQCGTGCCNLLTHQCAPAGICATGNVGEACRIDITPAHPSQSCLFGETISTDPANYTCLADTGFSAAKSPTAPPPDYGQQCQFCCDPDPDNNGDAVDAQISTSGLVCAAVPAGGGTCESFSGTERGLYCGCTSDAQCGGNTACSTKNDPTGLRCCRPRPGDPTIETASPIQCTNSAIVLNFGQSMDPSSINSTTLPFTQLTPVPSHVIPGRYAVSGGLVTFYPSERLVAGATIEVRVTTSVKNIYGISPAAVYTNILTVDAAAQLCKISSVKFDWSTSIQLNMAPPGLFTCAQPDGCAGDTDATVGNGNQNDYYATAVDSSGNPLSGAITYHWEEKDTKDVYEIEATCANDTATPFDCALTSHPRNGTGAIRVTASDGDAADDFDFGSAVAESRVTTFLCESPWPDPYTNPFPYEDFTYNGSQIPAWDFNFSLFYCRSEGNLPDLHIGTIQGGITAPLVDSFSPSVPNVDELLRQYAFFVTDSLGNRVGSDTIGIRVMENELNLPPDLWYRRAVGENPQGQSTTVDGFPALRVGRSTYVSIANVSGASMYPDMFIISYSDNATPETVSIYNQLLKNIRFTTNSTDEEAAQIRNDMKRVQDLRRVSLALTDYNKLQGEYPTLAAGSYINGFSVSTWPSWLQTLGATLKITAPTDPLNFINMCPLSYGVQSTVRYQGQFFSGLAADTTGRVYFVNYNSIGSGLPPGETKNLYRCDASLTNCSVLYHFGDSELPVGIGLDKSTGDILVASQAPGPNQGISRFDPNNPSVRKGFYAMQNAAHVATDSDGNMYVTRTNWQNGIYKYNPSGVLLTSIEYPASSCTTGPCPRDLEFIDNQLYVSDANQRTITIYDRDLQLVKQLSLSTMATPLGVAVNGDSLFVGDHFGSIYEIEKDLSAIKNVIAYSSLANPYELLVNNNGLYVANYSNHTIDLLKKNDVTNNTCWNEQTRVFNAPSGSRIYAYNYNAGNPVLYTNLEYHGVGNWINIPENTNVCSGGNSCPTFNFQWGAGAFEPWSDLYQTTGVPDTVSPTINAFAVPSPLTGTTTITVDAVDGGSGVDRALFYIDGDLKYTSSGSLEWIFNPSSYLDGTYAFSVRVFDKAGNFVDSADVSVQIAKAVNDQLPPSLSNFTFTPSSGNVVSGITTLRVTATDNQANDSGIAKVEYYLGTSFIGSCLTGDACASDNYAFAWDSRTVEDGDYPIYAVAFDNAGNTAFVKRDLTADNGVDTQLPSVFILQPVAGQVSGVIQVIAQAVDNQGIQHVLLELSVNGGSTYMTMTSSGSFPNPDSASPYSWAWNTYFDPSNTPIANGTTVTLRVTATDVNGLTRSATRDVVVNNSGASRPSAWFITPSDGDIYSPGLFEIFATDPVAVDHVDLYAYTGANFSDPNAAHLLGSVSGGNPYQVSWDYSLPDGVYGLRTIAYNSNNLASDPTAPGASIVVTIDTIEPNITSFTPPDGGTFAGTINFSVGSTDLNGIMQSGVFAWGGGYSGFVGSDCIPATPTSPYTCNVAWNTLLNPAVADGGFMFIGYAIDAAGNVGTQAYYNQIIDNTAEPEPTPDVTPPSNPSIIFNPALTNGWAKGTETITASSSDSESGIQFVDIYIDGVLQDDNADGHTCTSSPCNWVWNTTTATIGAHTVSAGAVDNEGNPSGTVTVQAPVDNVAPLINMVSPAANAYVSGTVTLAFQTTDGTTPPASGVQMLEVYRTDPNNPANLIGQDLVTPFTAVSWNTTTVADGDYQIFGVVVDTAGNRTVAAPRTVRVYNANPSLICGATLCGGSATSCCNNSACYDPSVSQCCCSGVRPLGTTCPICQNEAEQRAE